MRVCSRRLGTFEALLLSSFYIIFIFHNSVVVWGFLPRRLSWTWPLSSKRWPIWLAFLRRPFHRLSSLHWGKSKTSCWRWGKTTTKPKTTKTQKHHCTGMEGRPWAHGPLDAEVSARTRSICTACPKSTNPQTMQDECQWPSWDPTWCEGQMAWGSSPQTLGLNYRVVFLMCCVFIIFYYLLVVSCCWLRVEIRDPDWRVRLKNFDAVFFRGLLMMPNQWQQLKMLRKIWQIRMPARLLFLGLMLLHLFCSRHPWQKRSSSKSSLPQKRLQQLPWIMGEATLCAIWLMAKCSWCRTAKRQCLGQTPMDQSPCWCIPEALGFQKMPRWVWDIFYLFVYVVCQLSDSLFLFYLNVLPWQAKDFLSKPANENKALEFKLQTGNDLAIWLQSVLL